MYDRSFPFSLRKKGKRKRKDLLTESNSDKLTLQLLPRSWQETFSATGSTFLLSIVLIELASLALPARFRFAALDHWSHLGGYATGAVVGWSWKKRKERERRRKKEEMGFWERMFARRG
jgi:rhomboid-like protein